MEPRRTAHAAMGAGSRLADRLAARAGAQPAHRRRRGRAAAPHATDPAAAAGAALRRERLDGTLFAHAAALRSRADEAAAPGRGLSLLNRVDAHHDAVARPPRQRSRECRVEGSTRLVWRYADWRRYPAVPSAVDPPRPARQPGGAAHLRRLGPRRSRGLAGTNSETATKLSSADLAEPVDRNGWLRAI